MAIAECDRSLRILRHEPAAERRHFPAVNVGRHALEAAPDLTVLCIYVAAWGGGALLWTGRVVILRSSGSGRPGCRHQVPA